MEQDKYKKVLDKIQAQCVRREYCTSDIRAKVLKAVEGDEEMADEVVAALVADKFVDDLRYASAFAREKSAISGWGAQKISFMLVRKGIDKQIIKDALAEVDRAAATKKLESAVAAKYRSLSEDPQCRLKLLRFALGRGYGYDEFKSVVEKIMRGGLD